MLALLDTLFCFVLAAHPLGVASLLRIHGVDS